MKRYLIVASEGDMGDDIFGFEQWTFASTMEDARIYGECMIDDSSNDHVYIFELCETGIRKKISWSSAPIVEPPKSTSNRHRKWTKDEVHKMMAMIKSGVPYEKIAKSLGRTKKAVKNTEYRLRVGTLQLNAMPD